MTIVKIPNILDTLNESNIDTYLFRTHPEAVFCLETIVSNRTSFKDGRDDAYFLYVLVSVMETFSGNLLAYLFDLCKLGNTERIREMLLYGRRNITLLHEALTYVETEYSDLETAYARLTLHAGLIGGQLHDGRYVTTNFSNLTDVSPMFGVNFRRYKVKIATLENEDELVGLTAPTGLPEVYSRPLDSNSFGAGIDYDIYNENITNPSLKLLSFSEHMVILNNMLPTYHPDAATSKINPFILKAILCNEETEIHCKGEILSALSLATDEEFFA